MLLLIAITMCFVGCSAMQQSSKKSSNYWSIPPDLTNVIYEGGDGSSVENAITIKNVTTTRDGIAAEYAYIETKYGIRFKDWKPMQTTTSQVINERRYDIITIQTLSDNKTKQYFFDITEWYGKF